jgi:hypothetical protein
MLARQRGRDSAAVPRTNDPSLHVISEPELSRLLAQISPAQSGHTDTNLTAGAPIMVNFFDVIEKLVTDAQSPQGKKPALNEMDEDLINLVSMLFEYILDDYNLSPPIQVLISRLQIPILKVVIKDRSFFSKAGHPARKLLNSLARAGIGWSDSDEKTRDRLYDRIHSIALRILNEFDGDIALFEQLGEEFDRFQTKENRKAALVEQRTRESERGRIKSQKAQETVDQLLNQKLAPLNLPEVIRDILLNGWSRVMFLAYLRDDVEHRWAQTVQIADDLIWCLQPHLEDEERDQWVRVVPGLLKSLRAGLEEVSYNSRRLDEMMKNLKQELTKAFRNHALAEAKGPEASAPETALQATSLPPATEQGEPELEYGVIAEFMDQVEKMETGDWVEFRLVNGSRFRCKLSAVIEEADCFVFVNRVGLKVIEKSRTELALDIQSERLLLLEQGALVDRALGAVMNSLRRKSA